MGDMIERVARAICAVSFDDPDVMCDQHRPDGPQRAWTLYIEDARAAVAAIRDHKFGPMTICANGVPQVIISGDGPNEMWRCLFDAALSPSDPDTNPNTQDERSLYLELHAKYGRGSG